MLHKIISLTRILYRNYLQYSIYKCKYFLVSTGTRRHTQWVVASRTAGEVFFTVWTVLGSHAKEIAAVSVYKLLKKKGNKQQVSCW